MSHRDLLSYDTSTRHLLSGRSERKRRNARSHGRSAWSFQELWFRRSNGGEPCPPQRVRPYQAASSCSVREREERWSGEGR